MLEVCFDTLYLGDPFIWAPCFAAVGHRSDSASGSTKGRGRAGHAAGYQSICLLEGIVRCMFLAAGCKMRKASKSCPVQVRSQAFYVGSLAGKEKPFARQRDVGQCDLNSEF